MRKSLLLVVPLAVVAMLAITVMPAGAIPGVGANMTVLSPNLDNGFPCDGGGPGGLFSFMNYLNGAAGLPSTICTGTLFSGSVANFIGSGTDSAGSGYSIAGTGSISGSYFYSEPCQVTQAGNDPLTGEAYGAPGAPDVNGGLTLTIPTAVGVVGSNPVSSATVKVSFWWSRVGVTAIVGIKNITLTAQPGNVTISDPAAQGLAVALFIPVNQPACGAPSHPSPGDINIVSGTLTVGTP